MGAGAGKEQQPPPPPPPPAAAPPPAPPPWNPSAAAAPPPPPPPPPSSDPPPTGGSGISGVSGVRAFAAATNNPPPPSGEGADAFPKKKSENKAAAPPAAPTTTDDSPQQAKKKKLLNGVNIEYRYPSGSKYLGGFKDGKLHGFGKYIYYPSNDEYEGEWMSDMKHGHGTYKYEGGDKYTGEWKNGKKHGKGTYTFISGDEYVGSWKDDKIHGYGVFLIAKNNNTYEGEWEDSYRNGQGTLTSGNGDVYDGAWIRGKEEGHGVLNYVNGNRYCGEWRAGQMDGRGILIEGTIWYTVEHIAGYLVGKTAIPEGSGVTAVDTDWQPFYKAALAYAEKKKQKKSEGPPAEGQDVTKLKLEKEMYMKKYNDVLAAQSAAAGGHHDLTADGVDAETDIAALREQLKAALEGRSANKLLLEEALGREQTLKAKLQEAEFKGSKGGGSGGASDDMIAEMVLMREKIKTLTKAGATGGGGSGAQTQGELSAKIELLNGEVSQLRPLREELKNQRDQVAHLQKTVMSLEGRNEELFKELNLQHLKVKSLMSAASENTGQVDEHTAAEIAEFKRTVADLNERLLEAEDGRKKLKKKLKTSEEAAAKGATDTSQSQSAQLALTVAMADLSAQKSTNETQRIRIAELTALGAVSSGVASKEPALLATIESLNADVKKTKKANKKCERERDAMQAEYMAERLLARRALCTLETKSGHVSSTIFLGKSDGSYVLDDTTVVGVGGEEYTFDRCVTDDGAEYLDRLLEKQDTVSVSVPSTYLLYTPTGSRHSSGDMILAVLRSLQTTLRKERPKDRYELRLQSCCVVLKQGAALPMMRDGYGVALPTEVPMADITALEQAALGCVPNQPAAVFVVITLTHVETSFVQRVKVTLVTNVDKGGLMGGPVLKAILADCLGGNAKGQLVASLGEGEGEHLVAIQALRDAAPTAPHAALGAQWRK